MCLQSIDYFIPPGTIFIIPPGIEHGYFSTDDMRVLHILLSKQFIAKYSDKLFSLKGFSFLFNVEPLMRGNSDVAVYITLSQKPLEYISTLASRLIEYEDLSDRYRQFMKETLTLSLISEICLYVKSTFKQNEANSDIVSSIITSMEYMNKHLSEKTNLKDIAHKANMSYSTFSRHFKQICQCTPAQYLTTLKINRAAILLLQNTASISEIAQLCGFFDVSHFSRTFKQVHGMSPNAFKKRSISEH